MSDCLYGPAGARAVTVVWQNNVCISDLRSAHGDDQGVETTGSDPIRAATLKISNNVVLSPAEARRTGFATARSGSPYRSPASASAPTTGSGVNLTDDCRRLTQALCQASTFAGRLPALSRPSRGPWGVGAF